MKYFNCTWNMNEKDSSFIETPCGTQLLTIFEIKNEYYIKSKSLIIITILVFGFWNLETQFLTLL